VKAQQATSTATRQEFATACAVRVCRSAFAAIAHSQVLLFMPNVAADEPLALERLRSKGTVGSIR